MDGEFDLSFKDTVVFTGKVKSLLYEGAIIDMGDVIEDSADGNKDLRITRIEGSFK